MMMMMMMMMMTMMMMMMMIMMIMMMMVLLVVMVMVMVMMSGKDTYVFKLHSGKPWRCWSRWSFSLHWDICVHNFRVQAFSVATEYLFWRDISWKAFWYRACLAPHFDATLFDATFRTAATLVSDATLFAATFPSFQKHHHSSVWRHIATPHCFTPHFHDFGGTTTFVPDATFWRHIFTWRHIWTHIWRQAVFFHQILAFEMASRTGCRLDCMFPAAVIELARVVSTVTCC